MSTADVWANEVECIDVMPCYGSVILSDGKYDGTCLGSRLTAGNYMDCDIAEVLIMTDYGRPRQKLELENMCEDEDEEEQEEDEGEEGLPWNAENPTVSNSIYTYSSLI